MIKFLKLFSSPSVEEAKAFFLSKWRERAKQLNKPLPRTISPSDSLPAAMFVRSVVGGRLEANRFHCWIRLDGKIIDVTDRSHKADYIEDPKVMNSQEFKEKMSTISWRIKDYLKEWNARS